MLSGDTVVKKKKKKKKKTILPSLTPKIKKRRTNEDYKILSIKRIIVKLKLLNYNEKVK